MDSRKTDAFKSGSRFLKISGLSRDVLDGTGTGCDEEIAARHSYQLGTLSSDAQLFISGRCIGRRIPFFPGRSEDIGEVAHYIKSQFVDSGYMQSQC